MDFLQSIAYFARTAGERPAYSYGDECLTYRQLSELSDTLAGYLLTLEGGERKAPLVVYGHKDPYMLVCFLACMKAGHAYCPVDTSMPADRIAMILEAVRGPAVLCTQTLPPGADAGGARVLDGRRIRQIAEGAGERKARDADQERPLPLLGEEETAYIIFTSGSTGKPKGVQISYGALNHFLDWAADLGSERSEKEGKVFLDQAPFSFDLSVLDTHVCLFCGGTLCPVDKTTQGDYGALFARLRQIDPAIWVSTPSFADVCLADPSFRQELMPSLRILEFCGERLTNTTAARLKSRFPQAQVWNTYGPTESTVAMTGVKVTEKLLQEENPLPVGRVKPGTAVQILREDGSEASEGESGEIIIAGDTVSTGYFRQPELTRRAFFDTELEGRTVRAYRTGDEGYLKAGMLYYNGRIDLQVKLHGYRIELGDIENNLLRLPGIRQAVVVPRMKEGKAVSLTAFVGLKEDGSSLYGLEEQESGRMERRLSSAVKERLGEYLPAYMIPKKIVFVEEIPMTANGKADRRLLQESVS